AALGRFRETRRGYDLAVELGWRTHVDQCSAVAATLHQPAHVPKVGAQTKVRLARLVVGGLDAWRIGHQRPPFELPLLAAAIHQGGMLVAVNFADPVRECGEPVVVVAIKDDPRGVGDPALAHQLFEGGAGWNVAADRIAELGGPVEADRPLDVASLVSGGVHVDLQESDLGVLEIVVDPLGGYERRRGGVVGWHAHHALPFPAAIAITLRRPWSPAIRGNRRSGTYLSVYEERTTTTLFMRRCQVARRRAEGPAAGVRNDGPGWARAWADGVGLRRRRQRLVE